MNRYLICTALLLLLPGCAHVLSQQTRSSAVHDVSFHDIVENPAAHMGKTFLLGGIIIDTMSTDAGSEIEILQTPVDNQGYVTDRDVSGGRLLLRTATRVDPFIYRKDREITFAARLSGTREKKLGESDYRYPVFDAVEMYLWKEERYFVPYWETPYYYPYRWYDPFWPRLPRYYYR